MPGPGSYWIGDDERREVQDVLQLDHDFAAGLGLEARAIMPVHMLGNPCDMDAIMAVAEKHGLLVVEDACQAAGASYKGRKVGSIGSMGAFSLNVFKTITAGDGGLVVTDDKDLYERAFGLHDQGHKPLRAGPTARALTPGPTTFSAGRST